VNFLSKTVILTLEWIMVIIPWFSFFFLKKETIRHYTPVGFFTLFLMALYHELAYTQKWWKIAHPLVPQTIFYEAFAIGPFFIGTIWIFHLTYGKFWLYLIANVITDAIFMFLMSPIFVKIGFYKWVNQTPFERYIHFIIIAVVIYGYHTWQRKGMKIEGVANQKY
jgi:hypothetical protein